MHMIYYVGKRDYESKNKPSFSRCRGRNDMKKKPQKTINISI